MPHIDQGVHKDRYQIIPRVLLFIFRGEKEVLLIKGAPNKNIWANRYNGIGGHIEKGEAALGAARRELQEETGLEQTDLHLVGTILIDAGEEVGIGLYIYKGSYQGGKLVESKEGKLEWASIDHLGDYNLVDDLFTLLPKIARWKPGEEPFSARYWYDDHDDLQMEFVV